MALTQWKRGIFTEACRNCSVTIVGIVRLVYLIKTVANSASLTTNLADILIWTGVEVNVSIICGQYKASLPAALKTSSSVVLESLFLAIQCGHPKRRKKLANIKAILSSLACLPSLRPITTFIFNKLKQLRKHTSTPKRDPRPLVTMSSKVTTILPLFQTQNWDDGHRSSFHSSSVMEMEAKASESPKETGCSKYVETVDSAFQMEFEKDSSGNLWELCAMVNRYFHSLKGLS